MSCPQTGSTLMPPHPAMVEMTGITQVLLGCSKTPDVLQTGLTKADWQLPGQGMGQE